jgi:MFS family permease
VADLSGPVRVLALGVGAFAIAYLGFAFVGASIPLLAIFFMAAGVGIGAVETAEHSAVATLAPDNLRGSSFGALAAIQSFGNLIASALAGVLYAAVSATAAFLFPATAMVIALAALVGAAVRPE